MKVILILFFLWNIIFSFGQTNKNEFAIGGVFGLITSNNLVGSSWNYDHYSAYSGVNLKCKSIWGLQLQYKHFIRNCKWNLTVNYDRSWLSYSTILYSMNYNNLKLKKTRYSRHSQHSRDYKHSKHSSQYNKTIKHYSKKHIQNLYYL